MASTALTATGDELAVVDILADEHLSEKGFARCYVVGHDLSEEGSL